MKEKRIPNPQGRPPFLEGGKRRNIYIDEASWEKAREIGKGNPSEGIRKALSRIPEEPPSA